MNKARRRTVGILFGARGIVPLVAIAQLWSIVKASQNEDPTFDSFALALSDQYVS